MKTYEQQTLPFGETVSTCSAADSPASRSASRASARARRTTATSGRRCCGLFGLFDPVGSWARTFSELLIGREEWSSIRCVLTWKRQDTKCSRTLYRLAVSALPTDGTDAGLLPTVHTQGLKQYEKGKTVFMPLELLPTPTAIDAGAGRINRSLSPGAADRPTDNRPCGSNGTVADAYGQRCYEFQSSGQSSQTQERIVQNGNAKRRILDWSRFPTESPVCDRNDGFPGELAGLSFPAWCRESIKACGNAIVPQVALQIFETINIICNK